MVINQNAGNSWYPTGPGRAKEEGRMIAMRDFFEDLGKRLGETAETVTR